MRTEATIPAATLAAIRAPFAAQTATLIAPPIVQPLGLFLDLAGEAMRARLFVVQADGRDEACLRPELTIPVARAHIASGAKAGRYTYEGPAFRAMPRGEEMAHAEEFLQIGLEIYGGVDVEAEAEVVGLAWRSAKAGGRTDLTLRLGDAALFTAFVEAIGVGKAAAARIRRGFGRRGLSEAVLARTEAAAPVAESGRLAAVLAGLGEAEAAQLLDELWLLADIRPVGGRPTSEIVGRLVRRGDASSRTLTEAQGELLRAYLAIEGQPAGAVDAVVKLAASSGADLSSVQALWARRLAALEARGVPGDGVSFHASFGRVFDYYDGFLFDIVSEALGRDRPVASGGRYDGLLDRLGAASVGGAVGCMVRPGRAWKEASE